MVFSCPLWSQKHLGTENGDWRYWGGDEKSTRYSPLDQIDAGNVGDLEIGWRWKAANFGPAPDYIYRTTPIKVGDKLFTVAGSRRAVVAIDPETGETLWMYRMKDNPRWAESSRQSYGKGVAHAKVEGRDVIFLITPGFWLVALDPETGIPLPYFGINGVVDLMLVWALSGGLRKRSTGLGRHHFLGSTDRGQRRGGRRKLPRTGLPARQPQ